MTDSRKSPRRTNDSALARLRMERGMTQGQLAKLIGCRPTDVSRWERGLHKPYGSNLLRLADALGCKIEDIL